MSQREGVKRQADIHMQSPDKATRKKRSASRRSKLRRCIVNLSGRARGVNMGTGTMMTIESDSAIVGSSTTTAYAQFLASRVYSLSETSDDAEGGERLMDFLWYEGSSCVWPVSAIPSCGFHPSFFSFHTIQLPCPASQPEPFPRNTEAAYIVGVDRE